MKKLKILIVAIAMSFIGLTASAQSTANLNISLANILSFTVTQPAALTVNFDSETKYVDGITAIATDHISVVSTRGYTIKVISGVITGSSTLEASTIKISTSIGTTNTGNIAGITYGSQVILPTAGGTAITVITATNSSFNGGNSANKFNVTYLIGSSGVYAGKTVGSNVIPVMYSITQP